jgi:hypothetical protein
VCTFYDLKSPKWKQPLNISENGFFIIRSALLNFYAGHLGVKNHWSLLQALLLIGLGRIVLAFPKLNQRLERFHKSVVDEALMGKDPDVAEDFAGDSLSIEKILRLRQRDEICGSLKACSLFYRLYVGRAAAQIFFAAVFVAMNIVFVLDARDEPGECDIMLGEQTGNSATMRCRQKRFDFFFSLMWIFVLQLLGIVGLNVLILLWSMEAFGWRSVTR